MFIGFLPNVVLRFTIMSPLSVPNISAIGARIHVSWWILQSVRKEEKTQTLATCILEMAGASFFKFGM